MKKLLIANKFGLVVFVVLVILPNILSAQRRKQFLGERLQQYRRSFISQSIALEKKDSVAFWSVYEKHESKIRDIRKRQEQIYQTATAKSDEHIKFELQKHLSLQEEELQATRKLVDDLQKLISPRQILALFKAEKEVKKALFKRFAAGEDSNVLDD